MRDLKFRVWIDGGFKRVTKLDFERKVTEIEGLGEKPFDEVAILQATGMLDSSGTEIWEGDVVAIYSESGGIVKSAPVTFSKGAFGNKDIGWVREFHNCRREIIGSIYEKNGN